MSLRWVIPGELLSSIARFRFTHRSHPKPETSRSSAENQRTATVSKLRCLTLGVQSKAQCFHPEFSPDIRRVMQNLPFVRQ
jgi:hypothetical protein